jgi:hypothetical protein
MFPLFRDDEGSCGASVAAISPRQATEFETRWEPRGRLLVKRRLMKGGGIRAAAISACNEIAMSDPALRFRGGSRLSRTPHPRCNQQPTERTIIPTNNRRGPRAAALPAQAGTLVAPSVAGTRLERRSNRVLAPSKGEGKNP